MHAPNAKEILPCKGRWIAAGETEGCSPLADVDTPPPLRGPPPLAGEDLAAV